MSLQGWLVLVAIGLALLLVVTYNRLVSLRNGAANAFSTIDVQLRQRTDLVPRVVAAVKGYLDHERGTLERLTALRAEAVQEGLPDARRLALDSEMAVLLRRLFVRVEDYPELRASENVEQLQRTLNEVESQIAAARRAYNASATELNVAIESFPTLVVAPLLGFSAKPLFVAEAGDRVVPDTSGLSG
jgi:LemA protein